MNQLPNLLPLQLAGALHSLAYHNRRRQKTKRSDFSISIVFSSILRGWVSCWEVFFFLGGEVAWASNGG